MARVTPSADVQGALLAAVHAHSADAAPAARQPATDLAGSDDAGLSDALNAEKSVGLQQRERQRFGALLHRRGSR